MAGQKQSLAAYVRPPDSVMTLKTRLVMGLWRRFAVVGEL
jgi:hypothetical protein